jgi:hypothetical protein
MMRAEVLSVLFAMLLLGNIVLGNAQQSMQYCSDNSTLKRVRHTDLNVSSRNITGSLETSEDQYCPYGCSDNNCNEAPFMRGLKIFLGVVGFLLLILLILRFSGHI